MKILTNQEAFDKSAVGLLTQNAKSKLTQVGWHSSICAYRGLGGKKCAIGWLIDDAAYTPDLEFNPISIIRPYLDACGCGSVDNNLLENLQIVHDGYEVSTWKYQLERVATMFDLNMDVLKAF